MNYVDIIYDNPNNDSFKIKIENIQYKACIAITWAIQGTSLEYLYHELGLEFLETRRWYRKLIFFHKIVNGATTRYLTSYLNTIEKPVYNTRASDQNKIRGFRARIEHFRQSFFPVCVNEWYKLDSSPIEAKSIKHFKSMFKEFCNVKQRSLFAIHDPVGVKLLSRLRLKFSHLNEHAFRHNFKYASSPMCDCGSETKTTDHFFLRCPFFAENRQKLLNNLFKIDVSLKKLNDEIISFFYFVLTNIKTRSIKRYFFIQIISLKLPSALKGHSFSDCWYHFTANFLISLLHSHLFWKHDVITLLAPDLLLQISIFSPIFKQYFTGFRRE